MATMTEEQKPAQAPFDAKAYIENRTTGKTPEAKHAKAEPAKPAEQPADETPKLPRSVRRELNRLREELGAANERARLAMEGKTPAKEAPKEEAEPQRKDFASDGEYLRATQKWDKAQDAKAATVATGQTEQNQQLEAHLRAMDEKAAEDIKTLADWDEVAKKALEDEDQPEVAWSDYPVLTAMLANSDVRAFVLYHWAKHPADLEKLLEMKSDGNALIRAFHRLEGKLEKEYSEASGVKPGTVAQTESPQTKDRPNPTEAARPGGTAADREVRKPKPSSEVSAPGGSPAPDAPAIGSPAWMAKRNQERYGR